ncbi:autophagy-related protein 3, putative [Plasmodium yoelii]|uniref:Autophagy-related protein 3, putative n=1 Tax=Plasmodium yoelii TaxID=5861 RepID=A0A078K764_PLAYE|nr:autophagy-related protein 3, putative [Plasmodium yoelii]CDU16560.1 autophagy-related protein 3, putative [Plasmodium yoelii]VTZ73462.1 autophagy-related protein 3, putative [Plasmodium yoelii]|eukprot:XP_022811587.1 autophagy-related protein 3, putative [Plasmodium yoelii]
MNGHLNVMYKIGDTYRKAYSYFKPIANSSSFIKNGTLTPAEFVDAGDFLTHKFKTWEWREADENRAVPYLPEKKQFLISRNVPCKHRVKDLNNIFHNLDIIENEWIYPNFEDENNNSDIYEYINIPDLAEKTQNKEEKIPQIEKDNDDEEVIDINNFDMEKDIIKEYDPAAIDPSRLYLETFGNDNIINIRSYDISITYDKYYETPRIWLFGYNENRHPLKSEEIFEDILSDYSYKTVTYESHPCTGIMTASIHPCKHAEIMLNVINNWIGEGKEPRHDLYLLFLLKFISGVIPTIEYDFTTDIEIPSLVKNSKIEKK